MRIAKRVQAMFVLGAYGMFVVLGGCEWRPFGADTGDKGDAGTVAQRPACTDKVSACRNKCYQADLGWTCSNCCDRNGAACDKAEDYSFYACLDQK